MCLAVRSNICDWRVFGIRIGCRYWFPIPPIVEHWNWMDQISWKHCICNDLLCVLSDKINNIIYCTWDPRSYSYLYPSWDPTHYKWHDCKITKFDIVCINSPNVFSSRRNDKLRHVAWHSFVGRKCIVRVPLAMCTNIFEQSVSGSA